MNAQLMLFETIQTDNGDGTFTIKPKAVRIEKEIRVKKAMRMLGKTREKILHLCQLGEEHGGLKAYKDPTERGNSPWRIDWESAIRYKERRQRVR